MVTFLSYIGEQAMISVVHKADAPAGRFGAVQVSHGYLPFMIYVAKIVINFATLPVSPFDESRGRLASGQRQSF